MSALIPGLETQDIAEDPRPRRTAALMSAALVGLVLLVLAAVIVGILVTWAMVQPVLPDPGGHPTPPAPASPAVLLAGA
ncbi:hypothetical protein [Naasia aerilata]|uniref:Uncharacterized protein n=1 Tax=Naasia aerilata TaxID=1162966 RepID=A0ABM8GEJ9_9MICO|nr:hypothetical protein [Naasia aerilata]BDZ46749.1 hypothetical protein GCM10025866_26580 [Naasia aerilata]